MVKKKIQAIVNDRMYQNSFYLILNSIVLTGFGFFFWTIAAKLYTAHDVGLASTILSAMNLIVLLSGLGLGMAIMRHLPTSKKKQEHISSSLMISVLVALALSAVFVYLTRNYYVKLDFIQRNLYYGIIFVLGTVFSVASGLLNSVFTAFRDSRYVLYQSTLFSILKLIFPFFLVTFGAMGIFGSWVIAVVIGAPPSLRPAQEPSA